MKIIPLPHYDNFGTNFIRSERDVSKFEGQSDTHACTHRSSDPTFALVTFALATFALATIAPAMISPTTKSQRGGNDWVFGSG